MESNPPTTSATDTTTAFEHALEELILSAYGRGVPVEDAWEIDAPVSDAPSWRVTIEKESPAERTYEPSLLEE